MDSLAALGIADFVSLMTKVEITSWGEKVIVDCVYDPDDRLPYKLIFHNCRKIEWDLIFPEDIGEPEADIIDFQVGKKSHEEPAYFCTDIFELSILYGELEIVKSW